MSQPNIAIKARQEGAVLIVSLLFLIAMTLYTVSSMRSSNISMHMAQNEESRVAATEAAQALADALVADPSSTLVIGQTGYSACTPGQVNCDRGDLSVDNELLNAAIAENYISGRVERIGSEFKPPPRAVESSIDKFAGASFRVITTYDRVEDGLGRQQITEGVLVLVPR
jgi:Tfp pilus assembly protein PilX